MLSNTEAELKKNAAHKKSVQAGNDPSIVGHTYMYDKHYMPCPKIKNIRLGKRNANIQNKQIYSKKLIE